MQRRMKIMLICVAILFGSIFLYKGIVKLIINRNMANEPKIITVSAATVGKSTWQPHLFASGSLRATQGVNVTTELAGMVKTIYFTPGQFVKNGDLLIQLNADSDVALLHSLQANLELAKITYLRDKAQYGIHAISKQILDNDTANLESLKAQVSEQEAIVAKKTIRAPFTGRLGINKVNLGQYINPGDNIVSLQALDPVYADFYIPQQHIAKLKMAEQVIITSDTFSNTSFAGKITTIDPEVNVSSRNIQVEATIANPGHKLLPGMFVGVTIITDKPSSFLTVPQTAISFNSYGNLVYILRKSDKMNQGAHVFIAHQRFVVTGEKRGEQIKLLKGLKEGVLIVTSGQLKLKNDSQVVIDNTLEPPNNLAPKLKNNHQG